MTTISPTQQSLHDEMIEQQRVLSEARQAVLSLTVQVKEAQRHYREQQRLRRIQHHREEHAAERIRQLERDLALLPQGVSSE